MMMMTVERQLPRKSRIIRPVSAAASTPSRIDRTDRVLDEGRLVADRDELARDSGSEFAQTRHQLLDAVDDVERRRRARLDDGHQHGVRAVDAHHVDLRRIAVMHKSDVADAHRRAIDGLDRQDRSGPRSYSGESFSWMTYSLSPIFCVPTGMIRFWLPTACDDVLRRQAVGAQFRLIDVDLHLAHLAAIGRRHGRARDGRQLRADEVLRRSRKSSPATACRSTGRAG